MKLRTKTFGIISIVSLVLAIIIYFVSYYYFLALAVENENQEVSSKLNIVEELIKLKINDIDRVNFDWSAWNDTYEFVNNKNQNYKNSNLTDETFENLKMNFLAIIDKNNNLIVSKYYYDGKEQIKNNGHKLENALEGYDYFTNLSDTDNKQGLTKLFGKPILLTSRKILNSMLEGPSRGVFLLGRFLDEAFAEDISKIVNKKLEYKLVEKNEDIYKTYRNDIDNKVFIKELDNNEILVWLMMKNYQNKEILRIQTSFQRTNIANQKKIISHFLYALIVISILMAICSIILLKKLVLDKISKLKLEVKNIASINNPNHRLPVEGDDEISVLSSSINEMLSDLEESKMLNEIANQKINLQITALEVVPVGIVITDIKGTIVWNNESFNKLTGYSKEETFGNKVNILKSKLHEQSFYDNLWETIHNGNIWVGELINQKKDGSFYNVEMTVLPVVDENKIVKNFVAIQKDITNRIAYEKVILKAKDEAEKTSKLKSEFLAQMSHEIRTPLNSILTTLSLARSEDELESKSIGTESFTVIENSARRLVRTIDLLIDMSVIQSGSYKEKYEDINLTNEILQPIYNEYKSIAETKDLNFKLTLNIEEELIVKTDFYLLTQMISHLVDNAVKYTEKGLVEIKVDKINSRLNIEVIDTGIGMSETFMSKLFTPFTQEHQGYSRTYEGNGLSLSLVKKYSDILGAKLKVVSKKDVGSSFVISLEI